MPYIDPRVRLEFEPYFNKLRVFVMGRGVTSGELNYLVTILMLDSLFDIRKSLHYADLSATVAAVRDAADEFKRRLMDPYEDSIRERNGDIYGTFVEAMSPVRTSEEKKP